MEIITNSAKVDIHPLTKQDVILVWGGSMDVWKNVTKNWIKCPQNFVKKNSDTNIILRDAPHRHDLDKFLCVSGGCVW